MATDVPTAWRNLIDACAATKTADAAIDLISKSDFAAQNAAMDRLLAAGKAESAAYRAYHQAMSESVS